jgi:hypothetical protein
VPVDFWNLGIRSTGRRRQRFRCRRGLGARCRQGAVGIVKQTDGNREVEAASGPAFGSDGRRGRTGHRTAGRAGSREAAVVIDAALMDRIPDRRRRRYRQISGQPSPRTIWNGTAAQAIEMMARETGLEPAASAVTRRHPSPGCFAALRCGKDAKTLFAVRLR